MSVLINMEMPKTCRECPLEQSHDRYNCAITEKSYSWALSDRPSDCPLVPVPSHGRLIDADALDATLGIDDRDEWVHWTLKEAPTIIPASEEATP